MGNTIKNIGGAIGKKIQQIDNVKNVTEQGIIKDQKKNIEDIMQLNVLLSKNIDELGINLQLQPQSFVKNLGRWEKSLVSGKVTIVPISSVELQNTQIQVQQQKTLSKQLIKQNKNQPIVSHEQKKIDQPDQLQNEGSNKKVVVSKTEKVVKINVILTLEDIYQLKGIMYSFIQEQAQLSARRSQSQGKVCVICLQNKPQKVLPCAHSYCQKCMIKYVLETDKKCPMCRKQYRQSLHKNIYQIIQCGQEELEDMRKIFFRVLERKNEKQVQIIKKYIRKSLKHTIKNE